MCTSVLLQALADAVRHPYKPWWVEGGGHNNIEVHWREHYFQRVREFVRFVESKSRSGSNSNSGSGSGGGGGSGRSGLEVDADRERKAPAIQISSPARVRRDSDDPDRDSETSELSRSVSNSRAVRFSASIADYADVDASDVHSDNEQI